MCRLDAGDPSVDRPHAWTLARHHWACAAASGEPFRAARRPQRPHAERCSIPVAYMCHWSARGSSLRSTAGGAASIAPHWPEWAPEPVQSARPRHSAGVARIAPWATGLEGRRGVVGWRTDGHAALSPTDRRACRAEGWARIGGLAARGDGLSLSRKSGRDTRPSINPGALSLKRPRGDKPAATGFAGARIAGRELRAVFAARRAASGCGRRDVDAHSLRQLGPDPRRHGIRAWALGCLRTCRLARAAGSCRAAPPRSVQPRAVNFRARCACHRFRLCVVSPRLACLPSSLPHPPR